MIPSVIDTVTSKTFIDVFDQSAVNFIVECILLTLVFLLHATKGKMYHQYNSIRDTPSVYIKLSKEFSLQVLPQIECYKEVQISFRLQSLFFTLMYFHQI